MLKTMFQNHMCQYQLQYWSNPPLYSLHGCSHIMTCATFPFPLSRDSRGKIRNRSSHSRCRPLVCTVFIQSWRIPDITPLSQHFTRWNLTRRKDKTVTASRTTRLQARAATGSFNSRIAQRWLLNINYLFVLIVILLCNCIVCFSS